MRVLCIDGVKVGEISALGNVISATHTIQEGVIYTVIGETDNNRSFYLKERSVDLAYLKSRFIPCSEQDENELVNQREQTLINQ